MRIVNADHDDAVLAATAIQRLAEQLARTAANNQSVDSFKFMTETDRRFEQLVECVELMVAKLSNQDLVRYLWGSTMLAIGDEAQTTVILNEFSKRLDLHNVMFKNLQGKLTSFRDTNLITIEDLAAMIWSVGCVKDSYGWTNLTLVVGLSQALDNYELSDTTDKKFSALSPSLIIRTLWSLAGHDVRHPVTAKSGLAKACENISALSPTNCVSLLWCCARFRYFEYTAILKLINAVSFHLNNNAIARNEYFHASEALRSLYSSSKSNFFAAPENDQVTRESSIDIMKQISTLLPAFVSHCIKHLPNLPISYTITLLRALTVIEFKDSSNIILNDFIADSFVHFNTALAANATHPMSPSDASQLLQAMVTVVDYPLMLVKESLKKMPSASDFKVFAMTLRNEKKQLLSQYIQANPSWHRLAGRLAAICCNQHQEIPDKSDLLYASWAVAKLGHAYRPLYRVVRKATQFSLHELSELAFARLIMAIATEEAAAALNSGSGMCVKLDHEFVDQVALGALRRAHLVQSLDEQINAVKAVAFLGKLAAFNSRSQWSDSSDDSEVKMIEISREKMAYLTTGQLIEFQWAVGRLPPEVVSDKTIADMHEELQERNIHPPSSPAAEYHDGGDVSFKDAFLFTRSVVDAKNPDSKLQSVKDRVCHALVLHAKSMIERPRARSITASIGDSALEAPPEVVNPMVLLETIQTFIDLKWYNEEVVALYSAYLDSINKQTDALKSASNEFHFRIGILEELLKKYAALPDSTAAAANEKRLRIGGKFISRFLLSGSK